MKRFIIFVLLVSPFLVLGLAIWLQLKWLLIVAVSCICLALLVAAWVLAGAFTKKEKDYLVDQFDR